MSAHEQLHQIEQELDIIASRLRRIAHMPSEGTVYAGQAIDRIDAARDYLKDAMATIEETTGASRGE